MICLHFPEDDYPEVVKDPLKFRESLNEQIAQHSELFPPEIKQDFQMKDQHTSEKLGLTIRRITVDGVAYTISPSFITPYLTGRVHEVEKVLFLRKFSVPFWALAYVFGKNVMYWYRLELSVGRHHGWDNRSSC